MLLLRLVLLSLCTTLTTSILPCPPPTHVECSQAAQPSAPPLHITVQSDTEESFDLFWVNLDCKEQLWSTVAPGAAVVVQTYAGHLWRARSVLDKAVVMEYLTPSATEVNNKYSNLFSITVLDCARRDDPESTTVNVLSHMKALHVQRLDPKETTTDSWSRIHRDFPRCHPKSDLGHTKVSGFYVLCAATTPAATLRLAGFRALDAAIVLFECPIAALASPLGLRYCIKTVCLNIHFYWQ